MLKSKKHVFWEALLVTILVFGMGLFIGVAFESTRLNAINEYYSNSEISLMDVIALDKISELDNSECSVLIDSSLEFADRIYNEAKLLEKYDAAGRLSKSIHLTHKRYDLLRTFLWIENTKLSKKCLNKLHSIVYLYEYNTPDLTQKAVQGVWSKVLFDLKQTEGSKVILIPIAVDSNLISLNAMINNFNITKYPVVIINNNQLINELGTSEQLKTYLK